MYEYIDKIRVKKIKEKNSWHGKTIRKGCRMPRSVEMKCILHFPCTKDCPSYMTPTVGVQSLIENLCQMSLERLEFIICCDFEKPKERFMDMKHKNHSLVDT